MIATTAEPRCECCDLFISACGKRKQAQQAAELREFRSRLRQVGWFVAKWPGRCVQCGNEFDAGDMIKTERYGQSRYISECCAP